MGGTLRKKVIELDPKKVKLPKGTCLKETPKATITLFKDAGREGIRLVISSLGIDYNLFKPGISVPTDPRKSVENIYDNYLTQLESGNYTISCGSNFDVSFGKK